MDGSINLKKKTGIYSVVRLGEAASDNKEAAESMSTSLGNV